MTFKIARIPLEYSIWTILRPRALSFQILADIVCDHSALQTLHLFHTGCEYLQNQRKVTSPDHLDFFSNRSIFGEGLGFS